MKKLLKVFFIFITLCFQHSLSAQNGSEELKNIFNDAEYFLLSEDYKEALSAYLKVYRALPGNANLNYRIGLCYLNIPCQKTSAVPYLEFACDNISTRYSESSFNEKSAPPHSLFLLGTAYQISNDFDLAKVTFKEYKNYLKVSDVYELDFVDKQIEACERAERYMQEPVKIESVTMKEIIPQSKPNYNPVMSRNGEMIIYMTEERFYKAIWMARREGEKWSEPVNITPQVQSDGDCYPTSISGNGKDLYLVMLNNFGSDIYVSHFDGTKWSGKEKLNKPVNSRFWETHAAISEDGKSLYFTSNRNGGFGGLDIYKSELNEKGEWGEAVNLGESINTPYNEESPFIIEEGRILYFSSQGHEGIGGFDVFKSYSMSDKSWSIPVNLGYPINCTDDNLFYYPVKENELALYAGYIDEKERFSTIKEIRIRPVVARDNVLLTGRLNTEDGGNLSVDAFLLISNLDSKNTDSLWPDLETGGFSKELKAGKYEIIASAKGYETKKQIINIPEDYKRSEINVNISLTPEEVSSGEYYVIKNILFDFNSYELTESAKLEIERLHGLMIRYPELYIEVTGHTDSKGTPVYNLELSRKRANSVTGYLVSRGIDPLRFVSKGAGETENLALNTNPDGTDNPEGRKINRNARIQILRSENTNLFIEPEPVPDYLKPPDISKYTIFLASSGISLPTSRFLALNSITQQDVRENYDNSIFIYTLGTFYSEIQANEVLSTFPFREFPDAHVIRISEITALTGPTSMIKQSASKSFGIQLFALKNPVNPTKFTYINEVKTKKCSDGFYRVIFGEFSSYEEALEELPSIKTRGFYDAFIVDTEILSGKILPETSAVPVEEKFTIQLLALKTRVSINYFNPLGNIDEIEGRDGLFRYIYGEFNSLESAKIELELLKKKGYSDAFIRKISSLSEY